MFACTARGRARARGACVPLCWLIRLLIVRRPSLATKNVTHAGDDVVHGPAGGGGGEGPYRAAIGRDRRTSRVRRVYDVWRRRRCVVRVEPRGRRGPRDRRKARSGGRRDRGRCGNRSNDPGGGNHACRDRGARSYVTILLFITRPNRRRAPIIISRCIVNNNNHNALQRHC